MPTRRRTPTRPPKGAARRDAPTTATASDAPERWRIDAGSADIATLEIPASAQRRRVFEIDVRFVVDASRAEQRPWLALTVELDGVHEWSRRIDTEPALAQDSLDHHCRREVGIGRTLRVRALTTLSGARRVRLLIEAEEQAP